MFATILSYCQRYRVLLIGKPALGALERPVNEVMPESPILCMLGISRTIAEVPQSDDAQEGIRADKDQRKAIG
jgi:hypothetical protein